MSRCELRVELDPAGPVVAGTVVTGVLHVDVSAPVRCDGLTVQLRWFTHGAGNRASDTEPALSLYAGQWQTGPHRYPFSLAVPDRPLTTRGELVNLDWEVAARADIPWALDPKATADFVVERGPPAAVDPVPEGVATLQRVAAGLSLGGGVVVGMMFVGLGGSVAAAGVRTVLTGNWVGGVLAPVGFLFVGVGGYLVQKVLKKAALARRFEVRTLELAASSLLPGEQTEATVTLVARKPVALKVVEVVLLRRESATSGSGTDQTTEHHTDAVQRELVTDRLALKAGDAFSDRVVLRVPEDAVPSLVVSSNRVVWMAVLEVTVAGQETLAFEAPLQVR